MHISTLDILRCPYCGGQLEIVTTFFVKRDGDEIHDAILGCHCCLFPVVAGIPVMHLDAAAKSACAQVQEGRADLARRTMCQLEGDQAARFDDLAASETATYREMLEVCCAGLEGPTFCTAFRIRLCRRSPLARAVCRHGLAPWRPRH